MRSLSALFIGNRQQLKHLPRESVCSTPNNVGTRRSESSKGKAAFRGEGSLGNLLSEAFNLNMQGISKLFKDCAQLGRLSRNYSLSAQLLYPILQASRPEMPGYKTAKQGPGGCLCVVHRSPSIVRKKKFANKSKHYSVSNPVR